LQAASGIAMAWLTLEELIFFSTASLQSVNDHPLSLIALDLQRVDDVIAQRLASDVPLVNQISHYIIAAGGKRLRPALLLLVCGALGYQESQKYNLAAVVEFIHTATLLHDDVVDESTLRRGMPTANESFGNAASVLVGDFLYSRAFQMMVDAKSMRVMQILAEATNVIAEGEVLQLMNIHDASLDETAYLRVIRSKTAKLFEASARLAAVLAGSDAAIEEACATYGQALGTAFQVIDDALDYEGDSQQMGKNLGDDLREGKVTLPLIVAMRKASAEQAQVIRAAIESPEGASSLSAQLPSIMRIIQATGALEATHACAKQEAQRAKQAIQALPSSIYKDALLQLADQSIQRQA
jgi:octaprenyl-diphosphate synthase